MENGDTTTQYTATFKDAGSKPSWWPGYFEYPTQLPVGAVKVTETGEETETGEATESVVTENNQ